MLASWASQTAFKLPFTTLAHHSTTDSKFCFSTYSHTRKTLFKERVTVNNTNFHTQCNINPYLVWIFVDKMNQWITNTKMTSNCA